MAKKKKVKPAITWLSVGDYTALQKSIADREAKLAQKNSVLRGKIAQTVLTGLALKEGILKADYVSLFSGELDIDTETLEVKNMDEVSTAFTRFKKENPTLFGTVKVVPKVDSSGTKNVDGKVKLNNYEAMVAGLQERMKR